MAQPASEFNLEEYILQHVQSSTEWHLPFLPPVHLPSFLPVHGLMLLIAAALLLLLFCVLYRKEQKVPTGATNMLEAVVLFIRDKISIANLGEKDGREYTPFFCTLFFFILTLNIMGLFPIFPSATANINVTAALALITFTLMTVVAMSRIGVAAYFRHFVIPDLPLFMQMLLFPLELFSLFTRGFALAIRLFANMLAGHMMTLAFLGLITILGIIAAPSLFMAILINVMEVLVAVLQAFIFTLLSAVFIGQMYRTQH